MSLFDKIKALEPEASDEVIFDIIYQFKNFEINNKITQIWVILLLLFTQRMDLRGFEPPC